LTFIVFLSVVVFGFETGPWVDAVALLGGQERGVASTEARADDHHVIVKVRHTPLLLSRYS
jgi:hypothetical protein